MLAKIKTYKIIMDDNSGSRAIDGIAASCGGDWRNTVGNYDGQGHDIGFVDVPAENAEYLETILDADENVVEYSIVD